MLPEKSPSRARCGGRGFNVMRFTQKLLVLGNVGLLVGSVGWLAWQWRSGTALRDEVAELRTEAREISRLRQENARRAAGQISDVALKDLRADHEALERLRGELAKLKREADQRVEHPVAIKDEVEGTGPVRPAGEWREVGTASPIAALESALFAARSGQAQALEPLLMISDDGWHKIDDALKDVPQGKRTTGWPPARFVAGAMTQEFAVSSFQVLTTDERGSNAVMLQVRLGGAGSTPEPREVSLMLYKQEAGWRLIVPTDAVQHYLDQAKAVQGKAGGKGG